MFVREWKYCGFCILRRVATRKESTKREEPPLTELRRQWRNWRPGGE